MEPPALEAGGNASAPPCCQKQAEFAHHFLQKRSLTLLLVGATCGFLGFLCSTIIGVHKFLLTPTGTNYLGETFASGNNYRPQTVSEMVHNQDTPEGKAFFAFCLMGAICILASWYSWQLRNVYIGDTAVFCGRYGPSWANVRHYLPPLGMLLVVCIPVSPPAQRNFGEVFARAMHCLGAVAMIGGYGLTELHCLLFARATKKLDMLFKPGEWCQRFLIVSLSLISGVAFQLCGLVAERTTEWSCADDWRFPTADELAAVAHNHSLRYLEVSIAEAMRNRRKLLYDTASAECLWIKAGEFWFEVLAGFLMISSLWSIWYYSLERHIKMPERLPDVPRHFLQAHRNRKAEQRAQGDRGESGGAEAAVGLGDICVSCTEDSSAEHNAGKSSESCGRVEPTHLVPAGAAPGADGKRPSAPKVAPAFCCACF